MYVYQHVHVVMGNQGTGRSMHAAIIILYMGYSSKHCECASYYYEFMIRHYTCEYTDLIIIVNTHGVCVVCTNAICTVLF